MKSLPSLFLVSGWAHGPEALHALGGLMADVAQVTLVSTGELWDCARLPGPQSPWAAGLAEKAAQIGGGIFAAGWSMGGMVALEAACLRPGLFKGLMLISATPKFCSGPDWKPGVPPAALRAMAARLRGESGPVFTGFFRNVARPAGEAGEALRRKTAAAAAMNRLELSAGLHYLSGTDLRDRAGGLDVPALVIHGRDDAIVPPEAGMALQGLLPDARVKIHGGGHGLPWQAPGAVAGDMKEFLQECLSQHKTRAAP